MAEFKQGNVKVNDDKGFIFGNNDDVSLIYDTTLSGGAGLIVNSTIVGATPTISTHLTTKGYVDTAITTISGNLVGSISANNRSGQYSIQEDTAEFTVSFGSPLGDSSYIVVGTIQNTVDVETGKMSFVITNTTTSGFSVDMSDVADSENYKFNWWIPHQ